jgi:hypothetical protein
MTSSDLTDTQALAGPRVQQISGLVEPGWRPPSNARAVRVPNPRRGRKQFQNQPFQGERRNCISSVQLIICPPRQATDEPVLLVVEPVQQGRERFEQLGPCRIRLHDKDRRSGGREPVAVILARRLSEH